MRRGEQPPFISRNSVRSALDSLLYVSSPRHPSPLERLLIVDECLVDPDLPPGPDLREFTLKNILTSIIRQEYFRLRGLLGMQQPESNSPLHCAETELLANAQTGKMELLCWGVLYYRYVRSDLEIHNDTLSALLHVDERTLRRYQSHGIARLTEHLIRLEWNARIQQRKRRLIGELPTTTSTVLLGRDDAFQKVERILSNAPPHHIMITGMPGIGKTAFVQEVLRRQVEREQIDHIVWINKPVSVDFVRRTLHESLLPYSSSIRLREYTLLYRVALVLDGMELLQANRAALEEMLDYLTPAEVLLINRSFILLRNAPGHINLKPLGDTESVALAASISQATLLDNSHRLDHLKAVCESARGNPLAIKLAAQSFGSAPSVRAFFSAAYAALAVHLRRLWLMAALVPHGPLTLSQLAELWPSRLENPDLPALFENCVIEFVPPGATTFVLSDPAREFIHDGYRNDREIRSLVSQLVAELDPRSLDSLRVCEHILSSNWLTIDSSIRYLWIKKLWEVGLQQGHSALWSSILGDYIRAASPNDTEILTAYGICLRNLSEWNEAQRVFLHAVAQAGQEGVFVAQARGLLELSVLMRHRGFYQSAIALLSRMEQVLALHPNSPLDAALHIEKAQIAVDRGNSAEALGLLSRAAPDTPRILLLRSEACLLAGDFQNSRKAAHNAIENLRGNLKLEARGYAIVGRCYEREGNLSLARHYLSLATTLLEQQNDIFALARAQSNMGVVLATSGLWGESRTLLGKAIRIQRHLGDHVGLAASQHNLQLLDIVQLAVLP